MNVATANNAFDSATTSRRQVLPDPELTEVQYLAREIADARAAMARSADNLKSDLWSSRELRPWIRQYPWVALGVATVTGFTAAMAVTPAPGQSVGEKWASLRPERPSIISRAEAPAVNGRPVASAGVTTTILGSLFDFAKLVIQSLMIAAVRPPAPPPVERDAAC